MESPETKTSAPEYSAVLVAEGLGYGEGTISTKERTDVAPEVVKDVEALIQEPGILVDVDRDTRGEPIDDDGCGDGRGVKVVWEGFKRRLKSLNRAKVFGAGVAMSAADEIGSGRAVGKTLRDTFIGAIGKLKSAGLNFGGHTDDHAHGPNCGCGAIDKAPQVVANALKYEKQIRGSISSLGVDDTGLDNIFANYEAFHGATPGYESFSGAEIMGVVKGEGKVTKELAGAHKEWFIILNMVSGKTINQHLVREVSEDQVQVFGVDVWRLQEIAAKLHPDDQEAQHEAFLSKLVYTLSVAATLTKGDLPVYVIDQVEELVAA